MNPNDLGQINLYNVIKCVISHGFILDITASELCPRYLLGGVTEDETMDLNKLNGHWKQDNPPGHLGRHARNLEKRNSTNPGARAITPHRSPSQLMTAQVLDLAQVQVGDVSGDRFALESDIPSALQVINESKLASIVRKSLQRENFHIQGWRVRKLDAGVGNPVSIGLYRFEGIGMDRDEWLDWSVILKVIQSPANLGYTDYGEGADQGHWNYWKRELLVYRSGWLETLPEGLNAPRCYEVVELHGNIAGIWLEDINDSYSGTWPLYRYALAARHLGRLNGTYISRRELPSYPWFSQQRIRQWLNLVPWRDFPWDHPKVQQQFPFSEGNSFRRMLEDHERFLTRLDQLPKTISHGDTYPSNFKSRRMYRGHEQTIALDWALTGIEPIGDDLGQLVYGTWINLKGFKLQDISETLFASYMNGLQDKYCQVDPDLVRFGFTASAALRVGLFKLVLLRQELARENHLAVHLINPPAPTDTFETVMADEATHLLKKL
jgi:hypothetical protein